MVGSLVVGRFRIVRELGAGAFGQTFLAQDLQKLDAQCVVKRLITPNDPAHIDVVRQMFEKEAKKLDALNHQGIPKLIAYFEDGGEFYLVQDFVDGDTLDKEINPTRKWIEAEVTDFLLEVLEILAYVHSQGSIHRDLKPNNMMRRKANKKLVLIDFGAVREVRQTTTNLAIGLASHTITIGTPGYMPAEQTKGKPCYASDVYAIGCIAIEALIGISPHPDGFETDTNTWEIRWRHQTQVSDELALIIDKMVRYDFRQRYRNAGEALVALQGLPSNHVSNVPNPLPVNSVTKTLYVGRQSNSSQKNNLFLFLLLSVILLAGGGIAIFLFTKENTTLPQIPTLSPLPIVPSVIPTPSKIPTPNLSASPTPPNSKPSTPPPLNPSPPSQIKQTSPILNPKPTTPLVTPSPELPVSRESPLPPEPPLPPVEPPVTRSSLPSVIPEPPVIRSPLPSVIPEPPITPVTPSPDSLPDGCEVNPKSGKVSCKFG